MSSATDPGVARTRTGQYPIGFRRGWGDWQKNLDGLMPWAIENRFAFIDTGNAPDDARTVAAGMPMMGSADLGPFSAFITADEQKRNAAIDSALALMDVVAEAGGKALFTVMLPDDPAADRRENYDLMVAGYEPLVARADALGLHIVIEGYPGAGALACTPDSLRPLLERFNSPGLGVNYDPSHLVRLGVDPLRFLREFADRVYHVHAKDTELLAERTYELGSELKPVFAENIRFGGNHWRYALPGHGCVRWAETFAILADAGYAGGVSIELEDANFNGSEDGEKAGFTLSRDYLVGC